MSSCVVDRAPGLSSLSQLRAGGARSHDAELVGRWALAEMLAPGGEAARAASARARLDDTSVVDRGVYASLALGIFDEAHGEPRAAAKSFVGALLAVRSATGDPDAALIGWFAAHRLVGLRGSVTGLFAAHRPALEAVLGAPGALGWRAVAELLEWASAESIAANGSSDAADEAAARRLGCASSIRMAGPFGHGTAPDRRRAFPPERPGPWPPSWLDPTGRRQPHELRTEQHRCYVGSTEAVGDGVFYAQTFLTVPEASDLILAVQGALEIWVDDVSVLRRDLREWGVWQRFGTRVRVASGRHRVLARLMSDGTSVRVLSPDGRAATAKFDTDDSRTYSLVAPSVGADPNPIEPLVRLASRGEAAQVPWLRAFLGAFAAHVEGQGDVADVLSDPLAAPADAAAVALQFAASFATDDAALPAEVQGRNEKTLRQRAAAGDARLWESRLALIADQAKQSGPADGVSAARKLAAEFPAVPQVLEKEAQLYGELGWRVERLRAVRALAERFPEDLNALRPFLDELDDSGPAVEADAVATRIAALDPDSEVSVDRAIARHDWSAAVTELRRLAKRRPERKDVAVRVADILARAGDPSAAVAELALALARNPADASARLQLADAAYARGDVVALRRALADALSAGARSTELRAAIDLLDGATDLEPFRLDGRAVIAEFERWERGGRHMDGTAARVLDYSALWVHADATSDMLEHEILRVQSQEAIGELSEQAPPAGLVLKFRVIKPGGSILEPEPVAGKQTLSMPHLEVGDYVEIEHISAESGDGERGRRYRGPEWFFREPDKGYWRSEFVAVTPSDRTLEIETRGNVPAPVTRKLGDFDERRWRVDLSPPAPREPDSPPLGEFLPSVRIGWGISLTDTLDRLVDAASQETPLDPRLRTLATDLARRATTVEEQVRLVYDHVLATVAEGNESDGRRALSGKSGSRQAAFVYLLRQLAVPVEAALVQNRLATRPLGAMSESDTYDGLVLRISTGKDSVRWLTVRDRFVPSWYLPAEYRGQPAVRLIPGTPRDVTPAGGAVDGVFFEGKASLREDGSAQVELAQRFEGKAAIGVRSVLDKVPGAQLHDFLESAVVGRSLPGGRLRGFTVEHKDDLGMPVVLRMSADVPSFARKVGGALVLGPVFPLNLGELASLAERQTPLLLAQAFHVEVHIDVAAPGTLSLPDNLVAASLRDGDREIVVRDRVSGRSVLLDRVVDIPAGRVQPGEEYARYVRFVHDGDRLVQREIALR